MDLHKEAERLANIVQRVDAPFAHKAKVADTLRALSARLADVERERDARIEALEAEVARLREALERIDHNAGYTYDSCRTIARAALDQDTEQET